MLQKTHVVQIPNMMVIFLGEGKEFIGGNYRNGRPVLGQTWKGARMIFMPGTLDADGRIIYSNEILGHELGHILNGIDNQVADPHDK